LTNIRPDIRDISFKSKICTKSETDDALRASCDVKALGTTLKLAALVDQTRR
jgi:hypothetical protein